MPLPIATGLRALRRQAAIISLSLVALTGCDRVSPPSGTPAEPQPQQQQTSPITASPNPVPAGEGNGTTTLNWDTGDGSLGEVYVSVDGGEETVFSKRTQGPEKADWINSESTYVFRLYSGANRAKLLGEVKVTRVKK